MSIPGSPGALTPGTLRSVELPPQIAAPAPDPIHFTDGDVTLRSADGQDFRIHSIVLREASLFFRDMFRLPSGGGSESYAPILMIETKDVLDDLLRWLYPIDTAPTINNISHARNLLRAVERLQIESHTVKRSLHVYIAAHSHPLRAWALATRFGYAEARKDAVRRCLSTNDDFIDDIPAEMELVDAKVYMKLLRVKRSAIDLARDIIRSDVWVCPGCIHYGDDGTWRSRYLQRVPVTNPFDTALTSDLMVEMYVTLHGHHCCKQRVETEAYRTMNRLRSRLAELLASAGQAECSGGSLILEGTSAPEPVRIFRHLVSPVRYRSTDLFR